MFRLVTTCIAEKKNLLRKNFMVDITYNSESVKIKFNKKGITILHLYGY